MRWTLSRCSLLAFSGDQSRNQEHLLRLPSAQNAARSSLSVAWGFFVEGGLDAGDPDDRKRSRRSGLAQGRGGFPPSSSECQPPWRRPVPAPDGRPADDKGAIGYGAGDGSGASEAAPERLGVIQARDVCRHPVETDLDRRCYWGADLEPA
ncbi:hypothetical protein BHM03_00026004 [Ensete ventricosum]|nr:hypothetical protein BHM03_00026004 [Ensete ventricosum]